MLGVVRTPGTFSFSDQARVCLRVDHGTFTFPEWKGLLEKRFRFEVSLLLLRLHHELDVRVSGGLVMF